MKLLLLDQFSDLGGAQHSLLDLLDAIRGRGWQALVGLPASGPLVGRVRALGFPVERVECGPYASGRKSPGDLWRFLTGTPLLRDQICQMAARVDADLVFLNGPRLLPAAAWLPLPMPVLFHAHSFLFPGLMRRMAGASLRRMNAWVVGACRFVAEPWRPYVAPERLSIVYNGVAGPEGAASRTSAFPAAGCIGRIAPEKGQLEFLKAAAQIHRALPECSFSIYGAALFGERGAARYEARVRAAAAGLPVEFHGWVTGVYQAMAQLDLLLAPSAAHEATTRVIPEAFAAGVPAIAFRSGGIPEIVDHGRTGLLVSSAAEMAEQAIGLLRDSAARAEMARAAEESWLLRFTREQYQEQMLQAIERAARPAL